MPSKILQVTAQVSTGSFVQLDPTINGRVSIFIQNLSGTTLHLGSSSSPGNNIALLVSGGFSSGWSTELCANPSELWVRSSGAAANFIILMEW